MSEWLDALSLTVIFAMLSAYGFGFARPTRVIGWVGAIASFTWFLVFLKLIFQ